MNEKLRYNQATKTKHVGEMLWALVQEEFLVLFFFRSRQQKQKIITQITTNYKSPAQQMK